METAQPWYEALFGRPADLIASDDEVMWQICDGGWLYLVQDRVRAGHGLVAVAVPDLDRSISEMTGRGFERPVIEAVPGAGRKAPFVDPEGNIVTFLQVIESGA